MRQEVVPVCEQEKQALGGGCLPEKLKKGMTIYVPILHSGPSLSLPCGPGSEPKSQPRPQASRVPNMNSRKSADLLTQCARGDFETDLVT